MSHLKNWQTRKDQKFNHTVYVGLLNSCRFQSNAWQRPRSRLKLAEDLIGGGYTGTDGIQSLVRFLTPPLFIGKNAGSEPKNRLSHNKSVNLHQCPCIP
ncbi:MAG: hypothetical protein DMF00_11430 [Verrucomicrobia bacterium]|nr:MAG: hypothetical protein DMF00_11430 [Verrucomicrobiota bacterium]